MGISALKCPLIYVTIVVLGLFTWNFTKNRLNEAWADDFLTICKKQTEFAKYRTRSPRRLAIPTRQPH